MRIHPAPAPMFRAIVDHVTPLAQCRQLVERAVARVVVKVRTGQHHRRPRTVHQDVLCRPSHASTLAIAPAMPLPVPPSSIPHMEYFLPMGAPAMLAASPCPHEAHMMRELGKRPVFSTLLTR